MCLISIYGKHIEMNKISQEQFKLLLTDLYTIFNPDHLKYVDNLTPRYIDEPVSAVEMILMKYNIEDNKTSGFYDPDMNNINNQLSLIANYAKGLRPLQEIDIAKISEEKRLKEEKERADQEANKNQEEQKQIANLAAEQVKPLLDEVNTLKKQLEEAKKEKSAPKEEESDVEYNIKVNYTEKKINLPNAKNLAALGKGVRILASTEDGKPIGLEIVEIIYDDFSKPNGKTVVDIILDKG